MAKSLRSKTKRAFRRVKRESGVFAAADAARLQRLSSKLQANMTNQDGGDVSLTPLVDNTPNDKELEEGATANAEGVPAAVEGGMDIDVSAPKRVSTSGRQLSRRDAWRISKGKPVHVKNPNKLNRLGGVAAKRKPGRSKRRR